MPSKQINVGLIGLGSVGRGVARYFQQGRGKNFGINLKKVAVFNLKKDRRLGYSLPPLTDKPEEIINDPQIDIVVELIGGINPAKKYILDAIKSKKSVVTANKAVIAQYAKEFFTAAKQNNADFAFEGAVGGGIPLIRTLLGFSGEKINRVMAILNGTTNFILTQMEEGLDFATALKDAQAKGFAEANHILDTGGFDARDKLAILASLIFNSEIKTQSIYCEGITGITPVDVDFASKFGTDEDGKGYAIKLIAQAQRLNGEIVLRVNPALIAKNHPLASIRNELNAVYLEGELFGQLTISGPGAGTNPTTSAVISDILRLTDNLRKGITDDLPALDSKVKLSKAENINQKGYIRVNLRHKPGSLAAVAKILAKHQLNISDSIQRRRFETKIKGVSYIPDIITVESTQRGRIEKALKEVSKSGRVEGAPFFLGFED
ncbi:homoserine dehydrogenase [Candidatus Daviesbacteria bacterium]|nr:homoserine dehydrogenase [Candidatus Daviesbacteria bacterium]